MSVVFFYSNFFYLHLLLSYSVASGNLLFFFCFICVILAIWIGFQSLVFDDNDYILQFIIQKYRPVDSNFFQKFVVVVCVILLLFSMMVEYQIFQVYNICLYILVLSIKLYFTKYLKIDDTPIPNFFHIFYFLYNPGLI